MATIHITRLMDVVDQPTFTFPNSTFWFGSYEATPFDTYSTVLHIISEVNYDVVPHDGYTAEGMYGATEESLVQMSFFLKKELNEGLYLYKFLHPDSIYELIVDGDTKFTRSGWPDHVSEFIDSHRAKI